MEFTKECTFDEVIKASAKGEIDYTKYHFVLDEDGYLVFLKRNDAESEDRQSDEELANSHWPMNESDGEQLLKIQTGTHRGIDITERFLSAFGIKYLS